MPNHAREISEAYLPLPPERRGKHSAAFLPSEPKPSSEKPTRTPKHSKTFVQDIDSAKPDDTTKSNIPSAKPKSLEASSSASHRRLHASHETTAESMQSGKLQEILDWAYLWVATAARRLRKKLRPGWVRIVSAGVCGLAILGCIGGIAATAAHSADLANWAASANAESADEYTASEQMPDETLEIPAEDTSALEISVDESLSIEDRLALLPEQFLQNQELGALPSNQEPYAFKAGTGETFALSASTQNQLTTALTPFTDAGYNAGYLLVDIDSGRGIAANLDQQVYGASAIKAPFILFMCETAFPAGSVNFDTPFSEDLAWDSMDGELTLDSETLYPFMTLAESSITTSDNDAFRIIRANYESPDFRVWLDNLNLQDVNASEWFPYLSARDLGKLWLEMHAFWGTETETAWWLETHCSLTDMSFVRAALMSQGLYPDIVVADKAGWINGWDPGYHCLTDGSLVSYNGRTYLLCAVTDAPYDEYWESCFESLISEVFAAREELA